MAIEIRFEWDERKAAANKRKHGISFAIASKVFDDPFVERRIQGDEHGETRWTAVGQVGGTILHVTHTAHEEGESETLRLISARKATRSERRAYQGYPEDDR